MNWIKSNADKFTLAIIAIALLGVSGLLLAKTQSFSEGFSDVTSNVTPNNTIPPLEMDVIQNAQKSHKEPAQWVVLDETKEGSLFVGYKRLPDGTRPLPSGNQVHPPVPNGWLLKHKLNLLSSSVLQEDPDGDGFTNLDEWLGNNRPMPVPAHDSKTFDTNSSTDPRDKESHPAYHSKLWLTKWIKVPFRLRFDAYDEVPDPKEMTFQINTIDRGRRTEFLKLGEVVPATVFKLESFAKKIEKDPQTSLDRDVSELILKNTETGETITLVKERVTDSPDSYAQFEYRWPEPQSSQFGVKKLQEFPLKPTNDKYKLIDINDAGAQIALPSGEKYTVPYSSAQPKQ